MADQMEQDRPGHALPIPATHFVVQASAEGAVVVCGQAAVSVGQDADGSIKPFAGIAWHTQLFFSPASLKKLAEALSNTVSEFEQKIGPITMAAKAGS